MAEPIEYSDPQNYQTVVEAARFVISAPKAKDGDELHDAAEAFLIAEFKAWTRETDSAADDPAARDHED